MRHALSAVLAFLLTATATAQLPNGLIQPGASHLTLSSPNPALYDGGSHFKGKIWVSGTLVAQWIEDGPDDPMAEIGVQLVPDRASLQMLPYIRDNPVKYLELADTERLLRMTAPPPLINQLRNKTIKVLKVMGNFLLEDYAVGVECGSAWAKATLVTARVASRSVASHGGASPGC